MLSRQDNDILTQSGPGTPMGELFRRYWLPACLSAEIPEPDSAPVRVHILGEQLVAFRDSNGKVGLLEEHCPHRGTSLFFGRNEECGLRCVYHGWKFDTTGQCVDQRSEMKSFAHKIKAVSYPVHESGGIVWAYFGPADTMPPFRDFGTDSLPVELHEASKEYVDCNWVQSFDGDLDAAHISSLHQFHAIEGIPDDGTDKPGYPTNFMSMRLWRLDPKCVLEVENTWYGFRYAALRRTPNRYTHARVSEYVMPSLAMIPGVPFNNHKMHMIVPIDDESAWRYEFTINPWHSLSEIGGTPYFSHPDWPYQRWDPTNGIITREHTRANDYMIDRKAQKDVSFTGIPRFGSHDRMAAETAGRRFDRTKEHLGGTDLAVSRLHAVLIRSAKALAEKGVLPPGVTAGDGEDFRTIRAAEKILDVGEDWRLLGTDADDTVQAALFSATDDEAQ